MKVVRMYYGGREISHEDLEAALLVGMSPHRRRKYEKKRGASNKNSSASKVLKMNAINMLEPINPYSSETSRCGGSLDAKDQTSYEQLVYKPETSVKTPSISSAIDIREDGFATDSTPMTLDVSGISDVKDVMLLDTENIHSSQNPLKATAGSKCKSKLSLLGHGPHGKEVVDYLLTNSGEDGIHLFCQRWRQVFVDALHPRHLPAGWDVKHRYHAYQII